MHRLPVVCLAIWISACDVAGVVTGPPEAPDEPVARRLAVSLSIGDGQASVIGMRPVLDGLVHVARPGARTLTYELVGDDGQVLATGQVTDPRQVEAEWMESGSFRHAVEQRDRSLVRLDLPALDGDLVLRDGAGALVASVHVAGARPAPQALSGDALAALGPARLLSGGGQRAAGTLNILLLPDGYTAEELPAFQADAANHTEVLFRDVDFAAYRERINVYSLEVASNESGIDEGGQVRDTAFDTGRSTTTERLVYFTTAEGQAAAEELGRQNGADQVVVIANTQGYGGSGGATSVAARGSPEVTGHEIGHSMLDLRDEYDYGDPTCANGATGINVSASADRGQIPWAGLIDAATPLPTPLETAAGVVGAYEGGGYCPTGRYRPQHDCLMRTLGVPMCAVCRGALDRYMGAVGGGGGGGGGGGEDTGGGDPGAGGGDPGAGGCEYACADYGYAPGQCYEGWQCDDAGQCLSNIGTCAGDGGGGGDTGGGACDSGYACVDYGYAPDQCYEGWQCDSAGTCLVSVGTCPADDTGGGDTGGGCASGYTCADYAYAPDQCYEGWTCDSAGQCLDYTGGC